MNDGRVAAFLKRPMPCVPLPACFLDQLDQQLRQYKACAVFWGSRSLARVTSDRLISLQGDSTWNLVISFSLFLTLGFDPAYLFSIYEIYYFFLTIAKPVKK